jgi:hypothetical protein
MNRNATVESEVRAADDILGSFSELHDASLTLLLFRQQDKTVRMEFDAQEYATEAVSRVVLLSRRVSSFRLLTPPARDGFEDYSFPVNSLVDGINIEAKDGRISILLEGTYGWRIELIGETVFVEVRVDQS